MKIYDITQELFSGKVFPGDRAPSYERVQKIEEGDMCNLTHLTMCVHNATHMDAPYHFYEDGKTIDQLELTRCVGPCSVIKLSDYTEEELEEVLRTCKKRLLLKGNIIITPNIARIFNKFQMILIGVEGQSVGPVDSPAPVHYELLKNEVALLEGINLSEVEAGDYFLSAAPIKLGGCDGAPCRAFLLDFIETDTCIS